MVREITDNNNKENNRENLEANFYYALSHEIRRKIIKFIGDKDLASFTNLKRELNVSTGTIYHHLETLTQLIEQKKDKKYYLTDLGKHAYTSLLENIETIETPNLVNREFNSPLLKFLMALTPKNYFYFKEEDKKYILVVAITVLILGALLCGLNGYIPLLFYFIEGYDNLETLPVEIHVMYSFFFIFNVLAFYLIVEGMCRILYKKKENSIQLFISFGIIFFPKVFYLLLRFIYISIGIMGPPLLFIMDRILMIFFQIWSLWLLTYNLSITKSLRIENGLVISLLLHYGGFTILLLIAL